MQYVDGSEDSALLSSKPSYDFILNCCQSLSDVLIALLTCERPWSAINTFTVWVLFVGFTAGACMQITSCLLHFNIVFLSSLSVSVSLTHPPPPPTPSNPLPLCSSRQSSHNPLCDAAHHYIRASPLEGKKLSAWKRERWMIIEPEKAVLGHKVRCHIVRRRVIECPRGSMARPWMFNSWPFRLTRLESSLKLNRPMSEHAWCEWNSGGKLYYSSRSRNDWGQG